MIEVACTCGKRFRVQDEHAGKRIKCPACASSLVVPEPDLVVAVASPAPPPPTFPPIDTTEPADPTPGRPPLAKHIAAGFAQAMRKSPDSRTPEERRWDELLVLLRAICWRMGGVLLCLIILTVHSCSQTVVLHR